MMFLYYFSEGLYEDYQVWVVLIYFQFMLTYQYEHLKFNKCVYWYIQYTLYNFSLLLREVVLELSGHNICWNFFLLELQKKNFFAASLMQEKNHLL